MNDGASGNGTEEPLLNLDEPPAGEMEAGGAPPAPNQYPTTTNGVHNHMITASPTSPSDTTTDRLPSIKEHTNNTPVESTAPAASEENHYHSPTADAHIAKREEEEGSPPEDQEEISKKRSASEGDASTRDGEADVSVDDSKKENIDDGNNKDNSIKRRKTGHVKRRSSGDGRGGPPPSWNDMFFALMAFKAKLGTFNVPAQTKLGKWVTKQRQEYSKLQRKKIDPSKCYELSEERIQVLDSLGFIWDTMLHENDRRWNQRFEELKAWKEEHGHCNVPQSTSLGQWVKIQRENKREADLKNEGKLPNRTKPKPCLAPDRVAKLDSIGFQWRVAAPVTGWENRYQQLEQYAKEHNGDVNVPQYYPQDKSFGRWVMKQRSEYSLRLRGLKSQLTDERVARLEALGFSWVAPNFKRKVGVGIAPGSPAANIAAQVGQSEPKLPPMDKNLLNDDGESHENNEQQQQMFHHQQQPLDHHHNEPFQGLHHDDPHHMQHQHQHHPTPPSHSHHPHHPTDEVHDDLHHHQPHHDNVEDEVVNMEFL